MSLIVQGGQVVAGGVTVGPTGAQFVAQGGTVVYGGVNARPTGASLVAQGGMPVVVTSPLTITGLVAWWDAVSIGQADGTSVTSWADSSGNGYTLTEATNPPTYKTAIRNGLPIVRFDGINDRLANTAFADFGDHYTVFSVFAATGPSTSFNALFEVSNGTGNTGFYILACNNPNLAWLVVDTNIRAASAGFDATDGVFRAVTGLLDKGASTAVSIRVNASELGTALYPNSNANTLNQINVGTRAAGTQLYLGDLGELAIYNRSLNSAEIKALEAYFMTRWALP